MCIKKDKALHDLCEGSRVCCATRARIRSARDKSFQGAPCDACYLPTVHAMHAVLAIARGHREALLMFWERMDILADGQPGASHLTPTC